ncbi:4-hydroxy-tetrahydrodipicolinate reductase [Auritidibacter ignavus]|uniref:4-hydroxy-tetrahydrodipicolinate reductase n=1 Tax=Auritidibacter ignavus TaxID=678932 RepID=UPI00244B678E|nr:4-hydroxy-tetrahydrodipicolinate reductase [Auritidibacter ignavus]WGH84712.1 4-hydroxy-tetrahydrodipicolinate reductase [Auritidibacter ignavus]
MTSQTDIHVALVGATGKMGQPAGAAIEAAPDMRLVAQLNSKSQLEEILDSEATHVLDLTVPSVSESVVQFAVEHELHTVVGTSGWSDEKRDRLQQQLGDHPDVGVLIAPNFSIGSVLATQFATQAARYFDSVEIIEMHHPHKVDAPSGTATRTASMIAQARAEHELPPSPDATEQDPHGARGATIDDIHVHAVRLAGLEAHQEVLLGSPGQQLVLRHDAFDRSSYMPGVLLGLRQVADNPGLSYGLDAYLDLH